MAGRSIELRNHSACFVRQVGRRAAHHAERDGYVAVIAPRDERDAPSSVRGAEQEWGWSRVARCLADPLAEQEGHYDFPVADRQVYNDLKCIPDLALLGKPTCSDNVLSSPASQPAFC